MPKILSPTDVLQFRQRLCDLALKAFAEHGVEGVSLRGLAEAAGCSRTTPYRYFKDKAEILAAVRQAEFKRIADSAEKAARGEPNAERRLFALARAYINDALKRPEAYRLMYSFRQKEEHLYPDLVREIQRSQQPMVRAVDDALATGAIQGDPINIVYVLWAGLHGIISLHLSDKLHMGRDIEELSEVMIRSLGRAVASEPSALAATRRAPEAHQS